MTDLSFLWSIPIYTLTCQSYWLLTFGHHRRCLQTPILQPKLLSTRIPSPRLRFASTSWHYCNLTSIQVQFRWKSPYRSKLLQTSSFLVALTAGIDPANLLILPLLGKGYFSDSPVCYIKLTHAPSTQLRLCKNEFLTHSSVTSSPAEGNLGQAQ